MQLKYDKEVLDTICSENQISYLGVFGSYARDDADDKSDVDLLVEFDETPSLLKHIGVELELSDKLFHHKKVDLIRRQALNKYVAPSVLREVIQLYEK